MSNRNLFAVSQAFDDLDQSKGLRRQNPTSRDLATSSRWLTQHTDRLEIDNAAAVRYIDSTRSPSNPWNAVFVRAMCNYDLNEQVFTGYAASVLNNKQNF